LSRAEKCTTRAWEAHWFCTGCACSVPCIRRWLIGMAETDGRTGNAKTAFYTVAETARLLRVNAMTIYRAIRENAFPAIRMRSRYVIPAAAVDHLGGMVRFGRRVGDGGPPAASDVHEPFSAQRGDGPLSGAVRHRGARREVGQGR